MGNAMNLLMSGNVLLCYGEELDMKGSGADEFDDGMYRPCRAREGELPEGQERPVWTATRRAVWQLVPGCSCLHTARPVAVPYKKRYINKSQFPGLPGKRIFTNIKRGFYEII